MDARQLTNTLGYRNEELKMGMNHPNSDYVSRSRGVLYPGYFLMTPENMVANALPFFERTTVYLLATPRIGKARFGQYLLHLEAAAGTAQSIQEHLENFFYVLEGTVRIETSSGAH